MLISSMELNNKICIKIYYVKMSLRYYLIKHIILLEIFPFRFEVLFCESFMCGSLIMLVTQEPKRGGSKKLFKGSVGSEITLEKSAERPCLLGKKT